MESLARVASMLAVADALQLSGMSHSTAASRCAVDMGLADGVLNVGVIGAGRIGLVHLEALSSCETANPVIISNPTVKKAQAAAEKYKLPKFTSDAMEVINDPDVEAVWICSPSQFHADQIKACAAAGKHVFCGAPPHCPLPAPRLPLCSSCGCAAAAQRSRLRRTSRRRSRRSTRATKRA
jgi:threonine dehydrogenase-like Zn-dependent dehydrogenase